MKIIGVGFSRHFERIHASAGRPITSSAFPLLKAVSPSRGLSERTSSQRAMTFSGLYSVSRSTTLFEIGIEVMQWSEVIAKDGECDLLFRFGVAHPEDDLLRPACPRTSSMTYEPPGPLPVRPTRSSGRETFI